MNQTFTAIDFETANPCRTSICQVGIVCVENGLIVEEISLLVQPPQNKYQWRYFIETHGITAAETQNSPAFAEIWHQIKHCIEGRKVVAHNGFSFDFDVLGKTLRHYGIPEPEYEKCCTYRIYGEGLASLSEKHNIPLNHHDALSDARACAVLYLKHLNSQVLSVHPV